MPFDPPTWATPELVAEHGAGYLSCFINRAHFEHAQATGDIRRPASIRAAARRVADPLKVAREVLRKRVQGVQRAIRDAEAKIADAREQLGNPFGAYRAGLTIEAQTARLEERTAALKRVETDLAIFDALHTEN